jgi:hypothetical protein
MNRPALGRRLRSALVALTITAAAAGTSIAVAGPASATNATCTTSTLVSADVGTGYKTSTVVAKWGSYESIKVDVSATCSNGVDYTSTGTTYVQRSTDGGSTWTTVKSATGYSTSTVYYYGTNIVTRNTIFRGLYTGGTDTSNARTYAGSSDTIDVAMIRSSKIASQKNVRGGLKVNFKISPTASIKGLYVKFQVKKSGVWKGYKKVRATSTGHAIATFAGSSRGIAYRMVLPSARGFVSSYASFTVTRY